MICLNPCFSGGWSRRKLTLTKSGEDDIVLILVLVEDGLGDVPMATQSAAKAGVLILVLVEDGLGV